MDGACNWPFHFLKLPEVCQIHHIFNVHIYRSLHSSFRKRRPVEWGMGTGGWSIFGLLFGVYASEKRVGADLGNAAGYSNARAWIHLEQPLNEARNFWREVSGKTNFSCQNLCNYTFNSFGGEWV